jgi:hypothetical protein
MAVTVEVKSHDTAVKERREGLTRSVLAEFGEKLPELRLLAFFDDCDWAEIKSSWGVGSDNRGFYTAIKENTFHGTLTWPWQLTNKVFGNNHWTPDDERFFDHLIYLHGSTCAAETGLIMTFSHELQHFAQYGFRRKLWAVSRLIPRLPRDLIERIGLTWHDVPHEKEARIEAKRVGLRLCGSEAVGQYIERRISENITASDTEDWRLSQRFDLSIPYDLEAETKRVLQRLRPYRRELENVLQEMKSGPYSEEYKDIDLSDYFDAP